MRLTTSLSLPRRPSSVTRARQVIDALLGVADAADSPRAEMALIVTEACSNAVRHSLPGSTVDLTFNIDVEQCRIEVGNRSDDFHPARFPAGPPDPLARSGRGLPLIAALADSAAFLTTRPGYVLLRVTKSLT